MGTSLKNILIGVFVLAAIGIIVFMLLFLHPTVGDNAKTLRVRFTDIDKVNIGTRVTFAGKPVGEVISIRELPEARTSRVVGKYGDVYVYELTLKVDSGVDVFNSDIITLRTSGLLGERNIEINPSPLPAGQKLEKVEDQILYAAQTANVEDTMKEIEVLTKKFGVVLDDFHDLMENIKKEEVVHKVKQTVQNVLEITEALNQPEKWHQTLDNLTTLTARAHHSWTTIDQSLDNLHQLSLQARHSWNLVDQTLHEFMTTANNSAAFTNKANQIIDYTLQGQGSVGKLFIGDDLYLRVKSILNKAEVVMNDINSFGILFHLNKQWQRLQARRLRLLEKLSNPNEFSKHFNQEMNQISASLSRVSMVLNEVECYPQSLLYHPDFAQRFSELLKHVENMEENLKMYNEQVIDQEENPHSCLMVQ